MQEKSLAYFCNKSNVTAFEHKGNGRIFDNNEVTYQFNVSEISKVSKDLQKLRNPVALGSWLSCPCALNQVKQTFVTRGMLRTLSLIHCEKLHQQFSKHASDQKVSAYNCSFLTTIKNHGCKEILFSLALCI